MYVCCVAAQLVLLHVYIYIYTLLRSEAMLMHEYLLLCLKADACSWQCYPIRGFGKGNMLKYGVLHKHTLQCLQADAGAPMHDAELRS